MNTWLWIGGALLLGLVLGAAGGAWLSRRNGSDKETVNRLRGEIEDYKHEVTEHFVQTAELVNNLTRSYKAVYDHLEHGAYRLVGEEPLRKELDNVDSEPVQLEYIGRRDGADVLGGRRKSGAARPARSEHGTSRHGKSRHGKSQPGVPQPGASQSEAPQSGAPQSEAGRLAPGAATTGGGPATASSPSDASSSQPPDMATDEPLPRAEFPNRAADTAEERDALRPSHEEPDIEQPAAEQPHGERPAFEEPASEEPAAEQTGAERPKAVEPTSEDSSSEDGRDPVR